MDDVKKAGYNLDDYNLKMMDRIPAITSKKLGVKFIPVKSHITVIFDYELNGRRISVFQQLDKNMRRKGDGVYDLIDENGNDIESIQLSEEEQEQLREVAENELKAMLKDIYDSMYPEGK